MSGGRVRNRLERLPAICFLDMTGYTRGITFGDIRPVELRAVSGTVRLLRAHLS